MNKSLRSLILRDNFICNKRVCDIAEALKINKTLTNLNLSMNRIGNKGASALDEMLKVNDVLNTLYLSSNPIKKQGVFAMVNGILAREFHSNITLDLNNVNMSNKNISKALSLIRTSSDLKELTAAQVSISKEKPLVTLEEIGFGVGVVICSAGIGAISLGLIGAYEGIKAAAIELNNKIKYKERRCRELVEPKGVAAINIVSEKSAPKLSASNFFNCNNQHLSKHHAVSFPIAKLQRKHTAHLQMKAYRK